MELIFALRAAIFEIQADSQIAIFGHETWPVAKVPELAHILSKLPPKSQISLRFALRLPISKILAVMHFPIGRNVKLQYFFFKFKFEISKFP